MDLAQCNDSAPWVVKLAGPQPSEDRAALVFDVEDPCGVEYNALGSQRIPLVTLAAASGCVGGDCPGDLVLVRGHVQALDRLRPAGVDRPRSVGGCEGVSTHPRLKLKVDSCGWKGPVIIDADSYVIVPAGQISIEVLGPGPGPDGVWSSGSQDLDLETEWTDVNLRITACPCSCGWTPEGVLSEYLSQADETDVRVLLRPRRAVNVSASPINGTTGSVVTGTMRLLKSVNANDWAGAVQIGGNGFRVYDVGAFPAISLLPAVGVNMLTAIRWAIR